MQLFVFIMINCFYPSEEITFKKIGKQKVFENFLDFKVLTKSGKILIFEVKKNPLTKKDLKQAYEYYDRIHCRQKAEVKLIIIVLSNKGKISEYTKMDITYHPEIIKTKNINKQKELSIIRNKLHNNENLTTAESSLLIALPFASYVTLPFPLCHTPDGEIPS